MNESVCRPTACFTLLTYQFRRSVRSRRGAAPLTTPITSKLTNLLLPPGGATPGLGGGVNIEPPVAELWRGDPVSVGQCGCRPGLITDRTGGSQQGSGAGDEGRAE